MGEYQSQSPISSSIPRASCSVLSVPSPLKCSCVEVVPIIELEGRRVSELSLDELIELVAEEREREKLSNSTLNGSTMHKLHYKKRANNMLMN